MRWADNLPAFMWCLKIWEPQPHSSPSTCTRLYRDCFACNVSVSNDRDDELEMVRKETVVAKSEYYPDICMHGLRNFMYKYSLLWPLYFKFVNPAFRCSVLNTAEQVAGPSHGLKNLRRKHCIYLSLKPLMFKSECVVRKTIAFRFSLHLLIPQIPLQKMFFESGSTNAQNVYRFPRHVSVIF